MEEYLQNDTCKYSLSSLKNHFYLFTRGTVNVKVDDVNAEAIVQRGIYPEVYIARSVSYTEETSLNERYAFKKTLTVVFNGYNNDLYNIDGIIGIETMDGTVFVLNPEFNATSSYEYRLDNNDDSTTYTFIIQSNYPTLKTNFTHKALEECQSLKLYGSGDLYMIESNNAAISADGTPKVSVPMSKVEYNRDSLVFTENASGGSFTQRLTFDINFGSYKAYWAYDMIEFLYNTYAVKIDRKGFGHLLCGWQGDKGMIPKYTIETARDDRGEDVITMTFTRKGMYSIVADESNITEDGLTSWEFVEEVNGRSTMVCVGVGMAQYTLKRELNAFGIPTGRYMEHVDYDYSDWGINLVEEKFTEYKAKEDPSCVDEICEWKQNNIPSIVEYNYPYQEKTFTLQNSCGFEIVNIPSWLTVSDTYGAPDESLDVVITNTSYTAANGYITILDANDYAFVAKFIYDPTHIINDKSRRTNAKGRTISFTLNVPTDVLSIYGMSDGVIVNLIRPDIMEVTIPKNTTGSPRTLVVTLQNTVNGQTDTATILQDKIYTKRVLDGYLCSNGDKYDRYQIYESYYEDGQYIPTGVYEMGDLIEEDSVDCTGFNEKWEDLGDYICDGSNAYHAMMKYVSTDGGTTWTATGELQLGKPWETSVSCTEIEEHYVLTDKYQCVNN